MSEWPKTLTDTEYALVDESECPSYEVIPADLGRLLASICMEIQEYPDAKDMWGAQLAAAIEEYKEAVGK